LIYLSLSLSFEELLNPELNELDRSVVENVIENWAKIVPFPSSASAVFFKMKLD